MTVLPFLKQWSIAIASQLASFSAGASMGYPSVLLFQLKNGDSGFSLDLDKTSWIGSIHGLAGIFGVFAPLIMQWKGRKLTFIVACLILIAGWVLVYVATVFEMILLSETLHGFASNVLLTVCFDYLSEMITPSYRNVAVQSYVIVNIFGLATAGAMTKWLHWKVQSIIFCVPAVLGVLIACIWLESPLWLAFKEDLNKCKINFIRIRGCDEHSMKELENVLLANTERVNRNQTSSEGSFAKKLWYQVTRRDFLIPCLHIILLLNHCYWSGAFVILFYSIELITKTTQNETAMFAGGITINLIIVFGTLISNVLIKYYKNKPVTLISSCSASLCLICVVIVIYLQEVGTLRKDSLVSLYFLIGYMVACSLGQIIVTFTMTAELMPVKHRGAGGVCFVIFSSFLYGSSLKISPYLFTYLGLWQTFMIFILNSIVCGFLIWKYVPETKDRTLQEIENYYDHGNFDISLISDGEAATMDVTLNDLTNRSRMLVIK